MNAARIARLSAALATVSHLTADEAHAVTCALDIARSRVLRGAPVSSTFADGVRAHGIWHSEAGHNAHMAGLALIEALTGTLAAFDALSADRKANVIRYAMAVAAQGTEPCTGWGPAAVAIGRQVWAEVAALRCAKAA